MDLSFYRRQPPANIFNIFVPITATDDVYPAIFDMNMIGNGCGAIMPAGVRSELSGIGWIPGNVNSIIDIAMVWFVANSNINRFKGEFGIFSGQNLDQYHDIEIQTPFDFTDTTKEIIQITKMDADLGPSIGTIEKNSFCTMQVIRTTTATEEVTLMGFLIYIS